MLKKIIESPKLNILAGTVLMFAALVEILETIEAPQFGTHHGLFVFAIIHILKSILEILDGLNDIEKATQK
jgi:hypothetical protein